MIVHTARIVSSNGDWFNLARITQAQKIAIEVAELVVCVRGHTFYFHIIVVEFGYFRYFKNIFIVLGLIRRRWLLLLLLFLFFFIRLVVKVFLVVQIVIVFVVLVVAVVSRFSRLYFGTLNTAVGCSFGCFSLTILI